MAIDSDLLASLEGPSQLDTLKQAVERDPEDFNSWTDLLGKMDDQDTPTLRKYFDMFLVHFPLCYGYWKKYCDYETKRGSMSSPETLARIRDIYSRGVSVAPYCVDLWIYYMSFASVYLPSEARELFQKAVSLVGTDPKSGKLWDNFIMFETSNNDSSMVAALYTLILSTPFKDVGSYWDPYMAFASQQDVHSLATAEEMEMLINAYDQDEGNKMRSDEDKLVTLKQMLIDSRKMTFDATLEDVEARAGYEKKFKRLYFHVKPLGQNDVSNWRDYLDYELIHGDVDSITVLFERCLIPCAHYEEFWLKYVDWAHIARTTSDCMNIVTRCLETYLPQSVKILMYKALLIEEEGDVAQTREYLEKIITTTCHELLEAVVFYIEMLMRHGFRDDAEGLMERFSNEDYGVEANSFLVIYICNYYWKVRRDLDMARSTFSSNKDRCQQSISYWKFYLNFEYSTATSPSDALLTVLNEVLTSTLSHLDKLVVYELYIQYASTICVSIELLMRMKGDYTVWKLSAQEEQVPEADRQSQKRSAAEISAPAIAPADSAAFTYVPTAPTSAGAVPTDTNSPEYAQYYYQQYYQYYGVPYGTQPGAAPAVAQQ